MQPLRLGDYVRQVQSLVHDYTGSAWSRREMLERINDARHDVSIDCQCVRKLIAGVQLMRGHEIYSYDGSVVGVRITNRGSKYRRAVVTFTPPGFDGEGEQAEAVAHIARRDLNREGHLVRPDDFFEEEDFQDFEDENINRIPGEEHIRPGQIRFIQMKKWGTRYFAKPVITITDPTGSGSGATAEPIVLFNVINVISISPLWNTLRYTMSYKSFSIYQSWARALQAQGFTSRPGIWSIMQGERQAYMQPTPDQTYESEWDCVRLAEPLHGLHQLDHDIPRPFNMAVQFRAASLLLMKHQNFNQSEYYEHKYDAYVPRIIAGAGGVRMQNPYSKSNYMKMRRV